MSKEQSCGFADDGWMSKLTASNHGYIIIDAQRDTEAIKTRA